MDALGLRFSSHSHMYGPSREYDGIRYFITGGGASELRRTTARAGAFGVRPAIRAGLRAAWDAAAQVAEIPAGLVRTKYPRPEWSLKF